MSVALHTAQTHPTLTGPALTGPAGGVQAGGGPIEEEILAGLCARLFTSLPRCDQRRKGAQYIKGLLRTQGRKSIRNIATLMGGTAAEQSLHHFVSSSAWDWRPVRRELAAFVERTVPAQAWVVRPTITPKAGEHSVGVDRCFIPALGQVVSAQRSMGMWAAREDGSTPVNWRLHLPEAWLEDTARRRKASIPDGLEAETMAECGIGTYLDMDCGSSARPLIMDVRDADIACIVARLRTAGLPFLLRVNGLLPFVQAAGQGVPLRTQGVVTAQHLMAGFQDFRRPVAWQDHADGGADRTSLVVGVPVRFPERLLERGPELLLLGVAGADEPWPAELWLADVPEAWPAMLFRLSTLMDRVVADAEAADRVGVRDFTGRAFDGWHRHMTLASAAHLVTSLLRRHMAPQECGDRACRRT